ncbi:hypothetical protein [Amycolatopsis nigrescens]|nr:hypothetical protein [Amycolatopsis nigrescens]
MAGVRPDAIAADMKPSGELLSALEIATVLDLPEHEAERVLATIRSSTG